MWRDPLKLVGLAIIVLIPAKILGAPYLPEAITNYLDVVFVCLISLALIMAIMRRRGRL
jgi:hypothetical protein